MHEIIVLQFMDITLDTRTHRVQRGRRGINLTRREYVLLQLLMSYSYEIVSFEMIREHLRTLENENVSLDAIAGSIYHLRRKLCAEGEPNVIQTIRGRGYWLKEVKR